MKTANPPTHHVVCFSPPGIRVLLLSTLYFLALFLVCMRCTLIAEGDLLMIKKENRGRNVLMP
jgi:hypothetical protein